MHSTGNKRVNLEGIEELAAEVKEKNGQEKRAIFELCKYNLEYKPVGGRFPCSVLGSNK